MSPHPTRSQLQLYLRGGLETGQGERLLAHLAVCPECRRSLSDGAGVGRPERQGPARRSRPRAAAARLDPRLEVVERLLAASESHRHTDPWMMRELAELAWRAADRIAPRNPSFPFPPLTGGKGTPPPGPRSATFPPPAPRNPSDRIAPATPRSPSADRIAPLTPRSPSRPERLLDLRARAAAQLANACRLTGDLVAADSYLRLALAQARRGSGSPLLLARLCDLAASLLSYQRRLDEASRVMDHLQAFYSRLPDDHLAGRALLSKGLFASYAGDSARALRLLARALELIDPRRDRELAANALQNLAKLLCDTGRHTAARGVLGAARAYGGRRFNAGAQGLRLAWLEGRIAEGLGEPARAELAFAAAADGFAAAGLAFPSALAGLDLARLQVLQDRPGEALRWIDSILQVFRRLGVGRESLATLLLVRQILARARATRAARLRIIRAAAGRLSERLTP